MQKKIKKHAVALIPDFDMDSMEMDEIEIPETLPILTIRDSVTFPQTMHPVLVGRKYSMNVVTEAYRKKKPIVSVTQINSSEDNPYRMEDLYTTGVVCRVVKVMDMPNQTKTAILQCIKRVTLLSVEETPKYLIGTIKPNEEKDDRDDEFDTICQIISDKAPRLLEDEKEMGPIELSVQNLPAGIMAVNILCTTLPFSVKEKQSLLGELSFKKRAEKLLRQINETLELFTMRAEIEERTQSELNQQQREYYLHQEMKVIQDELGGPSVTRDTDDLREKAQSRKMPENVFKFFEKELAKLQRLNQQSPDYNVQLNYLQTMISLPWGHCTKDNLNITNAERTLDKHHYGMMDVKERILEHLAVLKLRGDMRSPILCLYGPPGVGKTSLGRSIADALKRKYVRASLGGLHDESEIRGHRRTYIGAMPGRILKGLIKAGSNNPVFILDEIDKISGQTVNGDPSSALLEVLDPEQNSTFHDNFLEVDYDLSNVMFIATANDISNIPRPLLDRMELIEVSGYCTEEKVEIANKHLIPKTKEENGLARKTSIKLTKEAIEFIIEHYTRESGVRNLEKQLNKVFRKTALRISKEDKLKNNVIDTEDVIALLGKVPYNRDAYQGNDIPGVATGLAWTSVGGEILFIETSLSHSRNGHLTLTGNLGDVMKESATIAVEYIKAHTDELGIDPRLFDQWDIHIHVPEGATPKDGPSAGITMVTSIVSCITQSKIRERIAMTGEITLRGKVLPVGGIKEKILAAKRAGITEILLCRENQKDIEEIPEMYLEGMSFHYVDTVTEVLDYALLNEKPENAKEFKIKEDDDVSTAKN